MEAADEHDGAAELVQELLAEALVSTVDPAPLLERLRVSARGDVRLRALADGLARAAASSDDVDTAVAWLREAAALRARLDDFAGSADALVAALGRRPGDEAALVGEVESLLTDLNDLGRLHAALEQHLGERHDEARLPILRKLSQLAETLGDEASAERWATETRRLEPPVTARVDMQALARTIVGVDAARLRRELEAAEKRLQSLLADDDVAELRAARRQLGTSST